MQEVVESTLSAEQQAVFAVMEQTHEHLFITGHAGTGKSLLLKYFKKYTRKKAVIVAPTGIAALNVGGQTIHSLFRLIPGLQQKGKLAKNSRVCSLLKRIDTLIIDEISMVRADLLDAIDERLQEAFHNTLPFGGIQVIMFGDLYQLPPIIEEGLEDYFASFYGGHFFFNAFVWRQTQCSVYELTQIFRQQDATFKAILNGVRDGSVTDEQLCHLNTRCGVSAARNTLTLATTNSLVTSLNQQRLRLLPGKVYEYAAEIVGDMKRLTFPTEEIIQVKVGAQIVLLRNDPGKRWVNGTLATIARLEEDSITIQVDGIEYALEQTTWEEIRYQYEPLAGEVKEQVVSSFTQYPIRLAWAMTVHKAQGQTYESVLLDLSSAPFAPGQLYVALSRCISMDGLYLKIPIKRSHILVEPKIKMFMAS